MTPQRAKMRSANSSPFSPSRSSTCSCVRTPRGRRPRSRRSACRRGGWPRESPAAARREPILRCCDSSRCYTVETPWLAGGRRAGRNRPATVQVVVRRYAQAGHYLRAGGGVLTDFFACPQARLCPANTASRQREHGRLHALPAVLEGSQMSIELIGAGLPRTGTLTQKLALEQLGLGSCYHWVNVLADLDSQVAAVEPRAGRRGRLGGGVRRPRAPPRTGPAATSTAS